MKKVFLTAFVVALIAAFAVSSAFAANARKGKRTWKKSCRVACHDGSKAGVPELSPVSKTQAQWTSFFENGQAKIKAAHKKGEIPADVSAADYEDMYEYLHGHALDSDQPETCG